MKYFRTYPWALQFLLFVLMIFTLASLGQLCLQVLLPNIYGISLANAIQVTETSLPQTVHIAMLAQGVLSIAIFMAPSLLFANLAHPKPIAYLGLATPKNILHPILAILLITGAMPILMLIGTLMSHIDFGAELKAKQAAAEGVQKAFLNMPTFADFLRTFTVMAIIPAIGEELFFRRMLMRFTRHRTRNMITPVIFTSLIFALAHANYYGLPSIFLAGVLLATIMYLTGSLWSGILAHMWFNGAQVLISYIHPGTSDDNTIHWGLAAGGAALFVAAFFMLWRTRTPLADDWYKDFDKPQNIQADEGSSIFN